MILVISIVTLVCCFSLFCSLCLSSCLFLLFMLCICLYAGLPLSFLSWAYVCQGGSIFGRIIYGTPGYRFSAFSYAKPSDFLHNFSQVTVTRNKLPEIESDVSKMRMKEELETERKISGSKPVTLQECILNDELLVTGKLD